MNFDVKLIALICIPLVALVFIFILIKSKLINKNVSEKLKAYFGKEVKKGNKTYDFEVVKDGKTYIFKYIVLPSNSCLAINYLYTWQIFWGGDSSKKGRAYTKTRFVNEAIDFCKMSVGENTYKICILYKETEHIDMYLNENEMTPIDVVCKKYGYSFVMFNKFDEDMSKVIKQ